jgi:ADP-dependent NAD(P)H-hydrate dehydratase
MADPAIVTAEMLRGWPMPQPGSSKEERGRVLVVGGTSGTPGAVRLTGEAALRAGAGKLRLATVTSTAAGLGVAVPESKVVALPVTDDGHIDQTAADVILEEARSVDAALVGSGFTDVDATVRLLELLMTELRTPLVLDALASAYLTEHPDGAGGLDGRAVLTANPNELAHVIGAVEDDVEGDPVAAARDAAQRCGVAVLCGGADKHVATPDGKAWKVSGGGPGLGVSGSGDVQAGIVVGLLAGGAEPAQAAVWGAFLHAAAGDRLEARVGKVGYLARELAREVPGVLADLGT